MSWFWIVLLAVNLLVIAVMFFMCRGQQGGDALGNAISGFVFWLAMIWLAVADVLAIAVRWIIRIL